MVTSPKTAVKTSGKDFVFEKLRGKLKLDAHVKENVLLSAVRRRKILHSKVVGFFVTSQFQGVH